MESYQILVLTFIDSSVSDPDPDLYSVGPLDPDPDP
jgi:hypothetical protein